MHREFDPTGNSFQPRSNLGLYLLTALLGALLIADLWPLLASWLKTQSLLVPTWESRSWGGFRFALIAAVIGGARVLFGSLEKLGEGKVGADLAVAIAAIAGILINEPLVAAEVVFIGLFGECLEAITFDRTQYALGQLTELFPKRCWVLRDGEEVRAFSADLQPGDHVVIKPGGKIPVDGVVLAGQSAIDTSALTGESLPRDVQPGDTVLAGSVVQNGSLTVDAKKVLKQTVAGQVIDLTNTALKVKSTGERLADKLARYFLPIVLALALLVFFINIGLQYLGTPTDGIRVTLAAAARVALYPTLAVLVVACPCPLVLATPAAVIATLGRLAGTGVLIKNGAAIERIAQATAIAFDKTGTLTEGQLELGDIRTAPGVSVPQLLQTAAIAEKQSEHPIAKLILQEALKQKLTLVDTTTFTALPGRGVQATVDDRTIFVGNRKLFEDQGSADLELIETFLAEFDSTGQTPLFVVENGQFLGAIGARDRARPEAPGVLSELSDMGLSPRLLLTGDRASVARTVAVNLALTDVQAELLPGQKAEVLANLDSKNVIFVGDGINDAPALASASVGVAIGTGADIAAEAGDVVMMGAPLQPLPFLIRLCREAVAVIRQNIIWFGFGVNLFGVLLTGILWPLFSNSPDWYEKAPLVGVLYHQLGSLLVLLNAMRLLAFERESTSRWSRRLRGGYQAVDHWLNTFHLHDVFDWLIERRKPVFVTVIAVALLAWFASGWTTITASEVGVVQRFGAIQDDLTPGWHYRYPWPIEKVTRIRPAEIRTVEIGFRPLTAEQARQLEIAQFEQNKLRRPGRAGDNSLTWASPHSEGVSRLTDESLLITGDDNLIEILATVRYTVSDPRQYLFGSTDPDTLLRSVLELSLRELTAGRPFQALLGAGRPEFERDAQQKLEVRLREAVPEGLGIRLEGLSVHDLHPPQDVVAAYHAVADALQRRDKMVNEATSEASRILARAQEFQWDMVATAQADAYQKVSEANATSRVILGWQSSRTTLPTEIEEQFQQQLQTRVAAGEEKATVELAIQKQRDELLAVRRFLTDFRLGLNAAIFVLSSRDKILIDADKIPGSRKLYLLDPNLFPSGPALAYPRGGLPERVGE